MVNWPQKRRLNKPSALVGAAEFAAKGKPIDPNAKTPDFRHFHNRIWAGRVSLVTEEAKQHYAMVHMNQILQNMRTARFQRSLNRLAITM